MKVFVSRIRGTRKIDGFYVVNTISDLFWTIDEDGDPYMTDVLEITIPGGLVATQTDSKSLLRRTELWKSLEGLHGLSWKTFASETRLVRIKPDPKKKKKTEP